MTTKEELNRYGIRHAAYNCCIGFATASAWFVTMGFYHTLLGVMRFCTVGYEARLSCTESPASRRKKEQDMMKKIGIILLFLPLGLSGTVVLTIRQSHVKAVETIMMLTIATFTFGKITAAVVHSIQVKRQHSPLLTTLRNISIADAALSVLPLQSSMILSFQSGGSDGGISMWQMTILTGTGICAVLLWLGISMIRPSEKEEQPMAKSKLVKANQRIADGVVSGFGKMQDTAVGAYQKIEETAVGAYVKMEDKFVDQYLTRDGESVADAKKRLKQR